MVRPHHYVDVFCFADATLNRLKKSSKKELLPRSRGGERGREAGWRAFMPSNVRNKLAVFRFTLQQCSEVTGRVQYNKKCGWLPGQSQTCVIVCIPCVASAKVCVMDI